MAIQATGRATFTAVEDYDIVFVLNGVRCDTLNFDSVRSAESAVFEADFTNGGAPCVVDRAVLACYDGEGNLMGSSIEVHDSSSAVADGGNLYLSKDCRSISCEIYQGEKRLCARSITVVRNGSGVSVKAVAYKVLNNVAAGAALNWDSVQTQANYPTQKPDKGKYCYVMTIVLYTDGTTTNSVSTSYTPTDGNNGTSVTIKETKVEYAGGDNGTTAPASGWNTSVPQLGQGKFLWTRTTVVFSDGKSTVSYSVGRIGMDGAKGGTTHILYASSDKPQSAADVRATIDAEHQYYGTYQDTALDDDVNKYKSVTSWVLIKGEKGDQGIRGLQGLQGERGEQGIQGPQGETGATGATGPKGEDGVSSYFHIAYADNASGGGFSQNPAGKNYIGTYVDHTATDSTNPSAYKWQLVKGAQGEKGDKGIAGTNGTDGKTSYLHIAYANSADGKTGFDVSVSTGKLYIGQYVDFVEADSTDPTKYNWTKIKGEQGAPGADGVDGTQYRTVEKYAYGINNTAAPTSGWSDSISGGKPGQYLWNQETVQHKAASDSDWKTDSVTTHCMGYIAKNGDNGANFTGILEHYKATADGTNAPAVDSSWQPTPTAAGWSADKPYLWNYETVKRDKGDDITTAPHLDGAWGAKGDSAVTYDLYLTVSVLKADADGKLNSADQLAVTCTVKKIQDGVATEVTDTNEAYFTMSRTLTTGDYIPYPSGNFLDYTYSLFGSGVKTWNYSLYVHGKFVKTVTLPVVRDGQDGNGTPATVYTIEPFGSIEASGTLKDGSHVAVTIEGEVRAYKITGDSKVECSTQPQCWKMSVGGTDYDSQHNNSPFSNNASNNIISFSLTQDYDISSVPGSANITFYKDNTLQDQLASLIVPVSLNAGAIQDINKKLGTIQTTTTSMRKDMNGMQGTIETIKQGQGEINLKVQDLQNGAIDTSKPHTSSQVDFTSLSNDNFYPVLIRFKNDGGVRHAVEISRPLDGKYGTGESYMTHGNGFSFRLLFSDVANDWGSREGGQLRIESISQYWTSPSDTPICPKIAQYYNSSIMVAWLRGGSKYDITVDCVDAYISGIWPYMMQVASNPSWVPDAVRFAPANWTTAQINAQGDNAYNLLKHDDGGFYSDTDNEYLYRFGNLAAGHTFAIVGQPKDSKQWFVATWNIASVSGSKVYVDISSYSIVWQTQNPLGIRMDGILGYIKNGVSYSKSTWDSEKGFGASESLDNTAIHANWVTARPILVIGKESSSTDGVYRDRAVLESVESVTEGSSVSFFSRSYFDVSPLYGTDGRRNVKTDLLATGIDIKSHKITATTDNFEVRSNSGTTTFSIDKDGNIVGAGNASFKGTVYASGGSFTGTVTGAKIVGSTLQSSDGTNTTTIQGGSITTNSITATGGTVSFFKFDQEGLYTPYTEGDNGAKWNGIGMSINNISVSGNSNNRISSVYLGNGRIDSRWSNSNNRTTYRAGNTSLGSTFYNYIKLEKINSSYNAFENDPEHAALGVETQGDVCITALGGPSCFQGLCMPSESGSGSMTADGKRTMYLFSGGDFNMPSNPPDGLEIKVIQTGSKITFHANGHRFRNGQDYRDTFTSDTRGQWNFFYFDGFNWHWNYMNN